MAKETDKRVFVAMINEVGQVLVIKRAKTTNNGGQWGLPGGHLDEGETLEQGARREVNEEIGVDIDFEDRSFVKYHGDHKRVILATRMPGRSMYQFAINEKEVESVHWMRIYEIAQIVNGKTEPAHRSLELAFPMLIALEPKSIYDGLLMRG